MEEQSKAEQKHREAARKIQIQDKNKEYDSIRRQTKNRKRGVNIEIASGVIDLILDMADEVYDTIKD